MLSFSRRQHRSRDTRQSLVPIEHLEPRQLLSADPGVAPAADGEIPGTLVPDVSPTLPEAVLGGAKARGASAVVTITNADAVAYSGPVSVTLFTSIDEAFQTTDDVQIATLNKRLKLEAGQSRAVKLKIRAFPDVVDGDYRLLARVTGEGVDPATNVSAQTVFISAPFVDLSGNFAAIPDALARGRRGRLTVTLANAGNVPVKTTVPVALTGSLSPDGSNPVPLGTADAKVSLKPGQSKTIRLNFTAPAEVPPGSYFLTADLDAGNVLPESNETNNSFFSNTAIAIG